MKKILLTSIILSALLSSGIAYAEVSSATTTRIDAIKQRIVDIKEQAAIEKATIKAEVASVTAKIKEARLDLRGEIEKRLGLRLDAQREKIANVFEKTIQNLKDLVTRIESRIAKMDAQSINTTPAKILLETAKTKITLAETEVVNFETLLSQPVSTGTRVASMKAIRVQNEKTKTAIRIAHKAIIDTVNSLKPGLNKIRATTTSEQAASTN